MSPNDDLARWGEPPTNDAEQVQADLLADALDRLGATNEPEALATDHARRHPAANASGSSAEPRAPLTAVEHEMLEASDWIEDMVSSVLTHSGMFDRAAVPADMSPARAAGVDLRVRLVRVVGPTRHQAVASTHDRPTVLRDMRSTSQDPERVTLHTGDRVRVEVTCDQEGYVTVFNIGAGGMINLLYPGRHSQLMPLRAGTPLVIADIQMTPPAGKEELYAVWSRAPLATTEITGLIRAGTLLRDMQCVQDKLTSLRPEDWHAVKLVMEHTA
jgi:hypothetical protein